MVILWAGGEDVDFPNGTGPTTISTAASSFRSGYARCGIAGTSPTATVRSNNFAGGALTSCWLSARWVGNGAVTTQRNIGLVKDQTTNSGLYVSTSAASGTRIALVKYDGTTSTQLAAETGNSLAGSGISHKVDMQLISFGASATVNIYVDQLLVITFSGDVTVTGVTSVSALCLGGQSGNNFLSEMIVSDSDTRGLSLSTLALTGAGTTNLWANSTFTNINATTLTDATPTNSNTTTQDNEYNVTDLPTGTFSVVAIVSSARAAVSSSPTATQIKMGYKNGANIGFGTGATKTPGVAYSNIQQIDHTDPTTSTTWAQADINGLQLDFQSA